IRAHQQPFDGYFELLASASVGYARGLDDLVGDEPGTDFVTDCAADPFLQLVRQFLVIQKIYKERHPVSAALQLNAYDERFTDSSELLDRLVDLGTAHPDALPVEGGVGSAVHQHRAAFRDRHPVAVPPHPGVLLEVGASKTAAVGIVPESDRHGGHRLGDYQL